MIIVTGSLAFDFIMDYPGKFADQIVPEKIHQINLSFMVETLREGFGGTAGNIAYNLGLLKQDVSLLATGGKDFYPYKDFLEKNNVDTKQVKILDDDFTARAFITTDLADNQLTGFYPGALKRDKELRIMNHELRIKGDDMVVISPTDPEAMGNFVNECVEKNIPFMFDPGMQLPRLSDRILKDGVVNAKILIGNDYEMSLIEKRIKKYELRIKDQIVITTLGEKGATIKSKIKNQKSKTQIKNQKDIDNYEYEEIMIPPAKPNEVLDPTGAGDAFRGGFLAGYVRHLPMEVCGRMGSLAAVYTVEKYGTTTHHYTVKDFCLRYKENFGEKLVLT